MHFPSWYGLVAVLEEGLHLPVIKAEQVREGKPLATLVPGGMRLLMLLTVEPKEPSSSGIMNGVHMALNLCMMKLEWDLIMASLSATGCSLALFPYYTAFPPAMFSRLLCILKYDSALHLHFPNVSDSPVEARIYDIRYLQICIFLKYIVMYRILIFHGIKFGWMPVDEYCSYLLFM